MSHLDTWAHAMAVLVRANRGWMGWNLLLATVPAVLAVALFARPHRRTVAWWIGVVAFVLFLPNAPYVVTDLIHLRGAVTRASNNGVVVAGILPLFATFVLAGFLAYVACTELVLREVRRHRPEVPRLLVEVSLHALSALGIVLGRIARLNSWDTLAAPVGTVERVFTALSWRGAPFAFLAVFAAVWVTHLIVRTLARAAWRAVDRMATRVHRPAPSP